MCKHYGVRPAQEWTKQPCKAPSLGGSFYSNGEVRFRWTKNGQDRVSSDIQYNKKLVLSIIFNRYPWSNETLCSLAKSWTVLYSSYSQFRIVFSSCINTIFQKNKPIFWNISTLHLYSDDNSKSTVRKQNIRFYFCSSFFKYRPLKNCKWKSISIIIIFLHHVTTLFL